jgi:hypothetical protein
MLAFRKEPHPGSSEGGRPNAEDASCPRTPRRRPHIISQPDPLEGGWIDWPDQVDAIDVVREHEHEGKKVPAALAQWAEKHDYYRFTVPVALDWLPEELKGGAERFETEIAVSADIGGDDLQITDIGPDTAWAEGGKGEAQIKIGYDAAEVLKLVRLTGAIAEGSLSWSYSWKSFYATVKSKIRDSDADWRVEREKGKYLDGQLELVFIVKVPKGAKDLKVQVKKARAKYEIKGVFLDDWLINETPLNIKVAVPDPVAPPA